MAVTRKTLIQNYNRELIGSYVDKYREIGQLYDSYENYSKLILSWVGTRNILEAPKINYGISDFMTDTLRNNGKAYSDAYIYSTALFTRDFFKYCKAVLPASDTKLITKEWLKKIVPHRKTAKRNSFCWLSDEDLHKILRMEPESFRIRRTQAVLLLASITGMCRTAVLTVPIGEINFRKMTVNQFPERGVYTEKLRKGITHIFPDQEITGFLKEYTETVRDVSSKNDTWFARMNRHGDLQPASFGPIDEENKQEAYRFALAPYGRVKDDLKMIGDLCGLPCLTLTMAQNTFIYRRLMIDSSLEGMKKIAADLLIKDIAPIRQCKKLMEQA